MRLLTALVMVFIAPAVLASEVIKKCQDAEGNWHYGDHAAFECEQSSRVTEIDQQGDLVGETEAPPTQEELDAKKRAEEQLIEQESAEAARQRLDQRLLVTYESADRILQTRDAMLAHMDSAIEADRILRERLVQEMTALTAATNGDNAERLESLRREIAQFDDVIRDRLAKRELASKRFEAEHKRFLELTGN